MTIKSELLNKYNYNHTKAMKGIDYSGIDLFFQMMDSLINDQDLTEKEWNEFFSNSGYKALTESVFKREFFIEKFKIAFMPSKKEQLVQIQNNLHEHPGYNCFLGHYVLLKERKSEILSRIDSFKGRIDTYIENSYETAIKYSDEFNLNDFSYPRISFLLFGMDGMSSDIIVVDTLAMLEYDKDNNYGFIGHEINHFYRTLNSKLNIPEIISDHIYFLCIFDRIHAEAFANQTDKDITFDEDDREYLHTRKKWFKEMVEKSPEIINKINEIIEKDVTDFNNLKKAGEEISKIVLMSGNPLGYFMYKKILESNSVKEINRTFKNPLEFFKLYNESVKKKDKNDILFSNKIVKIIDYLEDLYIVKN